MPRVKVEHEEVVRPVKNVTIELTPEEAVILKLICNYRSRVADTIQRATGHYTDGAEVGSLLYGLFRALHDQGVHAKDR